MLVCSLLVSRAACYEAEVQQQMRLRLEMKPRIGPHFHSLVLQGKPKTPNHAVEEGASSLPHSMSAHPASEGMSSNELDETTMVLNVTMDE